jgi:large subunit ribosomal protein L31e
MAKKDDSPKLVLERTYNIPLRKAYMKSPRYLRAKKAISALKIFLVKHMKSEDVRLGKHLNEIVWAKGMRNPPHHVSVNVVKEESGIVRAELVGKPIYEAKKEEPKKGKKAEVKAPVEAEPKATEPETIEEKVGGLPEADKESAKPKKPATKKPKTDSKPKKKAPKKE